MNPCVQTVTLEGKQFAILEWSEYERLRTLARAGDDHDLPPLPEADRQGNYAALPYARASLGRKIIRRRRAAGLTQSDLAKGAGIRVETLNRIERAKSSPVVETVEKIVRALERAEAEAGPMDPEIPIPGPKAAAQGGSEKRRNRRLKR